MLVAYIEVILAEFENRWHCLRLHGSDQAVHNFLIYTGRFIGTGEHHFNGVTATDYCLGSTCIHLVARHEYS